MAFYEKRHSDFYFRDDRGGTVRLACSPHLHRHIEIAYIIEGNVSAIADSEMYSLSAGDMFVAFPNQIHRFISSGPERYLLFVFDPELVPELSEWLDSSSVCPNFYAADLIPPSLPRLLYDLAAPSDSRAEPALREATRRGYLLAILSLLLSANAATLPRSTADTRTLRNIIDYCSQNYTRPLSLSLLADELHISKYYISHLFGDKLGIRFTEYINSLRIIAACRHLRHSDMSMTEIAETVGFSTLRTFNRAFIRQVGTSPSDYKKGSHLYPHSASIPH